MRCLRKLFRKRRLQIGVVLLPIVLWAVFLTVVPTDWARTKLAARLSQEIGQPVSLGAVRIGPFGGVTVEDLRIGSVEAIGGSWLKASSTHLNLGLTELLMGQCLPSEVRVDGLSLTYHRGSDGYCPIETALFEKRLYDHAPSGGASMGPRGTVRLKIQAGTVLLIDDPSDTRIELTTLDGTVVWEPQRLVAEKVTGRLNGGTLDLVAHFDRSGLVPSMEGQFRVKEVAVDGDWQGLSMLVPLLASSGDALEGQMDLTLYLRGHGITAEALRNSFVGQGTIRLDPVRLDGSRLLNELLPPQGLDQRIGAIRSNFQIATRKIASENLTIEIGSFPIVMSGWTDFDGHVDYRVKSEALTGQLRGHLGDFADLFDDLADLRVTGTLQELSLTSGGKPLSRQEGRERLKQLGRGLKDRILR